MTKEIKWCGTLPIVRIFFLFILCVYSNGLFAGESQWLAVGDLHNWFSSVGSEVELGRRGLIPDQQDGLRWPAQYREQDCQAAKGFWIGAASYDDPLAGRIFSPKVIAVGPRDPVDEQSVWLVQKFQMVGRFNHPNVSVDGVDASKLGFMERVDSIAPNLPADRMIYNVINTQLGITVIRKIYAFSQQDHDDYHIHDYVFKNTGIYDNDGNAHNQTLDGVYFYFQYRWAAAREACSYGGNWLPQSATWGRNTMNQVIYTHPTTGDPFRAQYSWQGLHSGWLGDGDNIGGPNYLDDGRLGASQYMGLLTLHADTSPNNPADDINQPSTTGEIGSDATETYNNDAFNQPKMNSQYQVMVSGRPAQSHADKVGTGVTSDWGSDAGGYSQGQGFGPYTIAPGDSVHIVFAEAVAGINRQLRFEIGENWFDWTEGGSEPYQLPNGSTTTDGNEYKNAWVYTGEDSIIKTLGQAQDNYGSGFNIPQPPPPPSEFSVTSGGDRIILDWTGNAESWPNFQGYNIYRAIFVPDTTYELLYTASAGENQYYDLSPQRGFEYYYYITSFDDGSTHNGVALESSKFYTMTNEPAFLRRPPGSRLSDIRIVPNPYNIKARNIQFGNQDGADRIMFYNIPPFCTIKIYTERGDLVNTIEHTDGSGDEAWTSITSSRQVVVSGVYIAYFEATEDAGQFKKGDNIIKKFIIIR
ncbi:fibronectin [Calditrichota bacterium]